MDVLRKDGEPLMKQEDFQAPHALYEGVSGRGCAACPDQRSSRRDVAQDLGIGLSTLRHWLDRRCER